MTVKILISSKCYLQFPHISFALFPHLSFLPLSLHNLFYSLQLYYYPDHLKVWQYFCYPWVIWFHCKCHLWYGKRYLMCSVFVNRHFIRNMLFEIFLFLFFNPFRANITKWSNTPKQFVGKLPKNCLSVSDHFVGLALKRWRCCILLIRSELEKQSHRGVP